MYLKIVLFALVAFLFSACSSLNTKLSHDLDKKEGIYSLKKAQRVQMKELVKDLEHYSVIFIGDHHNTKKTHKFFENLLKELDKEGYNLHLANEWFTPSHDKLLEEFTSSKIDASTLKQRREWDKFSKYKWEYLAPIYTAVKDNGGKLYGMNMSKEKRAKISLQEFDKMNKEEKTFYKSLDVDVSAHKQLVMPFLQHCKKMPQKSDEDCEKRMYRVQVAWDTYMANNVFKIANANIKSKKDKLLVFVGAMHVEEGLGIPLRFSRLSNLPFIRISNQMIDEELNAVKLDNNKADFVYIYKKVIKKDKIKKD